MNNTSKIWVAWEHQRRSKELAKAFGCELFVFDYRSILRYPKSICATLKLLIEKRPGILFVQNPSMILAALACFYKIIMTNTIVIVDRHTTFYLSKKNRRSFGYVCYLLLNRFTLINSDITIVTNTQLSDLVKLNRGIPYVLPDKLPDFNNNDKIPLNDTSFNLLMISSFAKDEPVEEVFLAMSCLQNDNITLYVTGNFRKLNKTVLDKKPNNVILTGYVSDEDFVKYLNAVDGAIILTTAECCMLCGCYEAVSAKKPFITSDKKVLKDYFVGGIFVNNTSSNIAESIYEMKKNYKEYLRNVTSLKTDLQLHWDNSKKRLDAMISVLEHDKKMASNIKCKIENKYLSIIHLAEKIKVTMYPYLRRLMRFIALPYCYISLINWDECKKPKLGVVSDLLYIFFVLKYFPYNYSLCRLWEKNKDDWKYYYGSNYEPYQRAKLSKEVQRNEYNIIFEDKEICYQLCKSFNIPLPEQYGYLDPCEDYGKKLTEMINDHENDILIVKPVRGSGGKNIVLAFKNDNQMKVRQDNVIIDLANYSLKERAIVQKYQHQHPSISNISPSFNTIRIVTLLTRDDRVLIIGAFMRFGVRDSYVDNLSRGGIAVGVNIDNGELHGIAYDFSSKMYTYHPTSKNSFSKMVIPYWSEVIALVKKTQKAFSFYRLLGHDVGITPNGPVLLELNHAHDNIALEQNCGPILKNTEIFKEYKKYNLIVNDKLFSVS